MGFIIPLIPALVVCRAFPVINSFYFLGAVLLLTMFLFYFALILKPNSNLSIVVTKKNTTKFLNTHLGKLFIYTGSFGLWASLTSIWSPFPNVSITRGIYFIAISSGAILIGYLWKNDERNDMLGLLLPANLVVILISLYSLMTSSPEDSWSGGHGLGFKGYATHQNALASAIIFTFPAVIFPLINKLTQKSTNRLEGKSSSSNFLDYKIIFYILIAAINIYLLLISVSRAALLTLSILFFVFILLNFKLKTILLVVPIIILASVISFRTIPEVKNFIFKTEQNIGDRRLINIKETIKAAKIGGWTGIGYGISATPSDTNVIGHYENNGKMFVREKMIGVLAIIEETGIIGLGLFILPFIFIGSTLFKKLKTSDEEKRIYIAFLIALIAALCFHAQIEAWWVGVGSIELPLFFMILGLGVKKE